MTSGKVPTHDLESVAAEVKYHGRKALILEDAPDFCEMVTEYLESHGFQVECVNNGADGLRKILGADFDVILCDVVMPHFPGTMFYLALNKTKPHLCRRIIFMTGHQGDRKIDAFLREIRGVVLWKPFEFYELTERIDYIFKREDPSQRISAA